MYGHQYLARLWNDESGISSVEYALLLAFVTAGIMAAAGELGDAISSQMEDTANCIENGLGC